MYSEHPPRSTDELTDHDRLEQEKYIERIESLRVTGRITPVEAEWYKHHYIVDTDWTPPDEA